VPLSWGGHGAAADPARPGGDLRGLAPRRPRGSPHAPAGAPGVLRRGRAARPQRARLHPRRAPGRGPRRSGRDPAALHDRDRVLAQQAPGDGAPGRGRGRVSSGLTVAATAAVAVAGAARWQVALFLGFLAALSSTAI